MDGSGWPESSREDPIRLIPGKSREGEERVGASVALILIKGTVPPKDSSARRTWTSACCSPTPARTGARAPTATAATAACASTAGAGATAARTSTTAPSPPARRGPPASTVWPPSRACAPKGRQVRPAERRGWGSGVGGRRAPGLSAVPHPDGVSSFSRPRAAT